MRKQFFTQPIVKSPRIPAPETSPWYWNPNRVGALEAPTWFQKQLRELDQDHLIDIRWNPVKERWAVFYRKPSFGHKLCSGWVLLFLVQHQDGSFMPLDERTLARLYSASAQRWGNGRKYFDAIQREAERAKEKEEAQAHQDLMDNAMDHFNYSQIKNIGTGSKFATYLS